ncbi:MAG: hypothetical protein ACKVIQ_21315, partial [Acidimicrobiales bacterium]
MSTSSQRALEHFIGVVTLDWLRQQVADQLMGFAAAVGVLGDRCGRDDQQRTNIVASQVMVERTMVLANRCWLLIVVIVIHQAKVDF